MADKKEWSLTEVKKSGVVTSKTATYTVDGKVAAVISGLSPEINTNSSKDQISGITVTEIASGGVIELSASVLNKAKVTLTQKNGYKYTLDVNTNVPAVTAENAEMTYSTKSNLGTITVKGNLTEGYTLASNGKSIAYAAAKTAQTLATISNLNGSLITDSDDGKIGEGEDGQVETAAVTLSGNTITLTQDALTNKNATLKLSNGSAFKLALNGVSAPTMNGEWTYKSGNATYTGTVSESGYVLSKDGKTVTYTAENDTAKALITVKGVVEPSEGTAGIAFQGEDNEIAHDANNFVTVVLPAAVLNKKNVTISGTGVNLALDNDVTDSDVKETNLWSVSGTTATYKTAKPEYYTYDVAKNQVVYTKQADKKTLATVSNLASGLTTAVTYDKNTHKISGGDYLIGFGNEGSVIVDDDGNPDKLVSVNSSGVITLKAEALNAKNVTLKNGTDVKYKLKLDDSEDNEIPRPTTSNEVWSVSGTTATLKGNTTSGYFETDDNTITFAKAFENETKPTTLVTVKGLKKGVSLAPEDGNTIGITTTTKDAETGETSITFAQGLVLVDGTGSRTIRLSQNVLGTTDVSISPAAGYGDYHFALYKTQDREDTTTPAEYQELIESYGGYVTTEAVKTKVFAPAGSKVSIKQGTATYYTLSSDGKTLVCTPGINEGVELASIKGLKNTLRADAEGKVDGIELVGNNIKIGKDVLNNATVTFGSNTGKFVLSLAADAPKPHETTVWDVLGTTALLEKATSAGYTPNSSGTELTYSAEKHGSTLATITGLRTGLTVKDGKIDGIQIDTVEEDEPKTITLSAKALGQTDVEIYNETTDPDSDEYYQLKIDSGSVAVTEVVGDGWKVSAPNNKGICTATYTVNTTKAGFAVPDNEESGAGAAATDDTSELGSGLKFVYKKKGKVTSTITGVAADSENFISTPDENGIITLSADALNPESSTVLTLKKPSGYKLALDDDVDEPKIKTGSFKWTLKKTTATLSGVVEEAGWEASADGFTVSYLAKPDEDATNKSTTLATITGIQSGISDDVLNAGITREGSVLTLSQEVLGASKIAVSGGKYAIKLDDEVAQEAVDATEWVTSGTTATYKTYKRGYYTPASNTLINFTKPTAGTTYATIKGIKSGATVTGDTKTVTLGADQLGTSKVTITGTGYSLKLDTTTSNKVATAPAEGEGWVTSGTTATYKKYTKAYYTPSGNTAIVYHAPSKGTTYATVSGIKSGAEITSDGAGLITLTEDQLAEKKVTLKGDGYKLALDVDEELLSKGGEAGWNQKAKSTSATYVQTFSVGYTLADDAKSIAYTNKPTDKTLATLSGIAKTPTAVEKDEIDGISFDENDSKIITLSTTNFDKNKVTLKSDTYKLGQGELAEVGGDDDPTWSLNSKKGTAIYQQNFKEGYTVSDDGKTITKSEATTTDLATISGLNKDALKYFINNGDGTETTKDDIAADALPGFTVTTGNTNVITLSKPTDDESGSLGDYDSLLGTSKKITLGKKDTFEFALDDSLLTAAGANKWTVSGTTATYSSSTTDGYKTTDSKTVTYVKAAPSDVLISISGLKKGLKTDGVNVGTATKNSDGTYSYSQGITLRDSKSGYYKIDLGSEVLGTTNITLTNNTKDIYEFDKITGNTNPTHTLSWSYSNGTATYKDTQTSGYELSASKDTVNYTAAATTTLATVSGLVKGFTGDIDDAIKVDTSNIITIKSGLLGTSKVSLKTGKGLTYSLDLDGGVAQYPQTKNAQWVTSGTTATYKDYQDAYYTIASDGKSISYVKPKDITVYATVKGIKSGVDITDSFSGDKTNGGTITLNSKQLTTTGVTVSKPKTSAGTYTLALKTSGDYAAPTVASGEDNSVTEWVTNKTTATYQKYWKGHYSVNDKGAIVYTKPAKTAELDMTKATPYATITGASGDVNATLWSDEFYVSGDGLSEKVAVAGYKSADDTNKYSFRFLNDYNNATITGSKLADTITAQGDRLSITGGQGDDAIEFSTDASRTGNVFIYTAGDGNDVITNFTGNDAIQIKSGFNAKTEYIDDGVITVVSGKKEGTITLKFIDDNEPDYITINGKSYPTSDPNSGSANVLLADNNYRLDAAQLSDIVQPAAAQYTPYDFDSGLGLTKEEKFTPEITFAKDDK